MGCLGVCVVRPEHAGSGSASDRTGSAVLVLGLGTFFPMGIPDSFIPQQPQKKIRRHRFCQGFRRWKVKSDIMDDANERTGPRDRKRQSARPTSDQRWSIDSQVPDANGSGLGWASVSFPDAINPLPHRVLPGASVETAMATRGSEHLRHLQWSRPRRRERGGRAGCRRRQREKEEGPVRSLRVSGGKGGGREQKGEKEKETRGSSPSGELGKGKGADGCVGYVYP